MIKEKGLKIEFKKFRCELNKRNEEIDILKGEAFKQINQIRGSITKFLDKETGTLGEQIKIVSILNAVDMAIGVLIESLLKGPILLHQAIQLVAIEKVAEQGNR